MSKHHWQELLCQIPSAELEKLAILRVLECSNGMIQLRFREGHPDALNVDDTRKAMQFSMRCIKAMEIPWGTKSFALTALRRPFFKKSERSTWTESNAMTVQAAANSSAHPEPISKPSATNAWSAPNADYSLIATTYRCTPSTGGWTTSTIS